MVELTKWEEQHLHAYALTQLLPDYRVNGAGDAWYGYEPAGQMFDINIYDDDEGQTIAVVYKCEQKDDGYYYITDDEPAFLWAQ